MNKVNLNNKEERDAFLKKLETANTFEDLARDVFDMGDDPRGPQYAQDMTLIADALYAKDKAAARGSTQHMKIYQDRVDKVKERIPADLRYD